MKNLLISNQLRAWVASTSMCAASISQFCMEYLFRRSPNPSTRHSVHLRNAKMSCVKRFSYGDKRTAAARESEFQCKRTRVRTSHHTANNFGPFWLPTITYATFSFAFIRTTTNNSLFRFEFFVPNLNRNAHKSIACVWGGRFSVSQTAVWYTK